MKPEDLTPYALETFELLKKELPSEIACRLKCSRNVFRHGSYSTVYPFKMWDKNQTDLFARNHFCYCLGYDPLKLCGGRRQQGTERAFRKWTGLARRAK
jgi:hypothetical protein